MSPDTPEMLAAIEYVGLPGISKECQDAVLRLLQYGDRITHVKILSSSNDHCLLLTVNVGDVVAVKSGFASGYLGEGSHTFSYVLTVLEAHGAEIDEFKVRPEVIERIDNSSLTKNDLETIEAARPVRPRRWQDYIFERDWERKTDGTLWREFPAVVPFAIIDGRLVDLALSFWEEPDHRLVTAYRRLEDIIRERTGLHEHGTKLFSQAFFGPAAKLDWKDGDSGEQAGKASLFTATYQAYRNRRAHRETESDAAVVFLAEFLLLNHLYLLEKESITRVSTSEAPT
jgi:hypothetical protein